jgi:BirA family biotin operon repressor/biotin-[acetyl-CoA-carboxylase] ligase
MLQRVRQWDRGNGFAAIRHDWLLRAEGVGAPIRVRTLDRELEGVFAALDSSGRLILAASDGTTRTIGAGEVFPLSPEFPPVGGAAQ